jgi:cytochrome oxidase assembly protein ShyY1
MADESRVLVPRVRYHRQRSEASLILLLSVLLAIATGIGFLWQLTRHSTPTVITVAADE